jgi:Rha family phage regulatory protein
MNDTTVVDMRQFVLAKNGEAFTSSQSVAEAFGKQHKDVLRKIDTVECSPEFRERNFTLTHETLMSGAVRRQTPVVEMTKDGFMFLVMGFTGKRAAAIKEGYIAAFNWMAGQLGMSATDVVSGLIAASELATLKAVMQDKAKEIAPERRISFLHTMHHRLHTRFNVPRTELIRREQFADACNFVAAYALEGEWIASSQTNGMQLSEREVQALYLMMSHYHHAMECAMKSGVYAIARVTESRPLMNFYEHLRDMGIGFRSLDERRAEIYQIYSSQGLKGGYAMGVAA